MARQSRHAPQTVSAWQFYRQLVRPTDLLQVHNEAHFQTRRFLFRSQLQAQTSQAICQMPNLVRLSVPHYLRLQVEDAETASLG